ncbi:low molecular weight protein-tyrosine-phosphatase [Tunicatimonas pelagia]|uniref:low molecular weight protein-tyrosine-phosphatase n=1 Tax=Tunicatimonas pelagia TaxID=931531 RepID=UPI002665E4EF|nr:low molecular weight protein-tyrosine-phosphatase [Tunicatimonas pelagia]WKN40556.1 low molecular weight phosphotyrosine protein phosphatase [Tunicatimonas pelagia]
MIRVLFVCLGNICRSPMAEAVFNSLVEKNGLAGLIDSDSAGTSDYHIGEPPDSRTMDVVQKYHLNLDHQGRQFTTHDFHKFNYIMAMDQSNLSNIKRLLPSQASDDTIFLMRDFDDKAGAKNVPDPYWSEADGFEEVYQILLRSCQNFIDYLKKNHTDLART